MVNNELDVVLSFPKKKRLLNSKAFDRVFKSVQLRASNRFLLILAAPNQLPHPRLGLVIAKKNIRLSVKRNQIKRLIRESFREQQQQLPAIDAIVLARKGLDLETNASILKQLQPLWQKIKQQAIA